MTSEAPGVKGVGRVIAAGDSGNGLLRATIMLTPSGSPESLAHWPSMMISHLNGPDRKAKWTVKLNVEPIQRECAGAAATVVAAEKAIDALAHGARVAWSDRYSRSAGEWSKRLDELWASTLGVKSTDMAAWGALQGLIDKSTQGSSSMTSDMRASGGTTATDAEVAAAVGSDDVLPPSQGEGGISFVLPTRQTDLAAMLELNRARELCLTLHAAVGSQAISDAAEVARIKAIKDSTDDSESVHRDEIRTLITDSKQQYEFAKKAVQSCQAATSVPKPNSTSASPVDPYGARDDLAAAETALERPLASYTAANPRQAGEGVSTSSSKCGEPVRPEQQFFTIQGTPGLARLFMLTFDVYLEKRVLEGVLPQADSSSGDGSSRYFLLSLAEGDLCSAGRPCVIKVLTKYRSDGASTHFFPTTRAEEQARPSTSGDFQLVAQTDGYIVTGKRVFGQDNEVVSHRISLASLDIRGAIEAAVDQRHSIATSPEPSKAPGVGSLVDRASIVARKSLRTGGLTILDRLRNTQATAQLAGRDFHYEAITGGSGSVTVDADDLLLGYRIDVSVPDSDGVETWRPLNARELKYGFEIQSRDPLRNVLDELYSNGKASVSGASGGPRWRQTVEDAYIALPARVIARAKTVAFVDESLCTWQGAPLGAECAGPRTRKVLKTALPMGCVVRLPVANGTGVWRCPPRLRFGWPYDIGLRAVLAGCISMPIEHARPGPRNPLITDAESQFSSPGRTAGIPAALKRFLRHERIEAPFLLLPESIALRWSETAGYEKAARAIVRTARSEKNRDRATPRVTQRVFVAPAVDQNLATMHGVFDAYKSDSLPQGLAGPKFGRARYDAPRGGFPVAVSRTMTGINGHEFEYPRQIAIAENDTTPGDLVYALGERSERKEPYFPDPSAALYVIGIRIAGTGQYLDGKPCVVSVLDSSGYPSARPLSVTVRAVESKMKRQAKLSLQDVLKLPSARNSRLPLLEGPLRIPGAVEIVIEAEPGHDFEVDVWCAPTVEDLARKFAVIEAIGALIVARASAGPAGAPDVSVSRDNIEKVLKELLPKQTFDSVMEYFNERGLLNGDLAKWTQGQVGPGDLPAPSQEVLEVLAKAIHSALCRRPISELAAVRTLRATHAVDQPERNPAPELTVLNRPSEGPIPVGFGRIRDTGAAAPSTVRYQHRVRGLLKFHLPTTGAIEVQALATVPHTDRMDDVQRGRASLARAQGAPIQFDKTTTIATYGFEVTPDGQVSLPRSTVIVHSIPRMPLIAPDPALIDLNGVCAISGDQLFSTDGPHVWGEPSVPFQFADGLARRMALTVRAKGRHLEQLRSADRRARDGFWLREGTDVTEDSVVVESKTVGEIWLNAAVRPAAPLAKSPIPVFRWRHDPAKRNGRLKSASASRITVVRIPLARPWFSSGEDERLGIIVWPPNLREQSSNDLDHDIVSEVKSSRRMSLVGFEDSDLGSAGAFVTRWGGDPIASGLKEDQSQDFGHTFIPAEAFLDLDPETRRGHPAEFVQNVLLPIQRVSQPPDKTGSAKPDAMLPVSLVCYSPRFDTDLEEWYVEVAMEHPFEAEPFVRFGLVRYQPHADDESIQLSYPCTQWAQLLPRRDVAVTMQQSREGFTVNVEVTGFATELHVQNARPATLGLGRYFNVCIAREQTMSGGACRRRVLLADTLDADIQQRSGSGLLGVWTKKFASIDRQQWGTGPDVKHFVYLEEREARLPASYVDEPVTAETAKDASRAVSSGPRFSVRIDL